MFRKISLSTFILAGAALLIVPSMSPAEQDTTRRPAEVNKEDADNTRINRRDRSQQEPTAGKQKEKSADRMISQKIRRAITKDSELSTYARNVKIITQDGQVTLKGPVRSDKEKTAIEEIAHQVAGKGKVTNEIQVTPDK